MVDLTNSAVWTAQLDPSNWESGAALMIEANEKLIASNNDVDKSTKQVGKDQTLTTESWNRHLASIDPGIRAQVRYNTELKLLDLYQKSGVASADELVIAHRALEQSLRTGATPALEETSLATKGFQMALGAAQAAIGPFLAYLSIQEVIAFGRSVEAAQVSIAHEAEVLDLSTTALQAYQNAALLAGVSVDTADGAIRRLIRSIDEGRQHEGTQRKALFDLGLTEDDLKNTPQAIAKVSKALYDMKDAGRQASDGVALTGKAFQEIRPVLKDWAEGADELQKRLSKLGYTPEQIETAKKNFTAIDAATQKLKVDSAPAVNWFYSSLVSLLDQLNEFDKKTFFGKVVAGINLIIGTWAKLPTSFPDWLKQWADGYDSGSPPAAPAAPAAPGAPSGWGKYFPILNSAAFGGPGVDGQGNLNAAATTVPFRLGSGSAGGGGFLAPPAYPAYVAPAPQTPSQKMAFGQAEQDKSDAEYRYKNDQLKLSVQERALENEAISQSVEKQIRLGKAAEDVNKTYEFAVNTSNAANGSLSEQELTQVKIRVAAEQHNAELSKTAKLHAQNTITLAGYLAGLDEETRLAGMTRAQREDELAIQKAATIVLQQQVGHEHDKVRSNEQALTLLGKQTVEDIKQKELNARIAEQELQHNEALHMAVISLTSETDQRELNLAIAKETRDVGTDQLQIETARLTLLQRISDAEAYKQITEQLQQQNELAGMYGDHLEQEQAVQSAILTTHHELSDVQANELRTMIAQNQELAKQAQLMSGIQSQFTTFFNSLMHGDLKIGTLVTGILDQYMNKVSDELSSEMMAAIFPQKSISAGGPGTIDPAQAAREAAALASQSDSRTSASILLSAQTGSHPLHVTMTNLPGSAGGGDLGSGLVGQQASGDYYNAFGDNLGKFTADTEAAMTAGGENAANDITSAFDKSGTGFVSDLGKVFSDGASLFGDLFSALTGGGSSGSSLGKFLGMVLGNVTGISLGGGGGGNFTPMDVTPGPMDLSNPVPSVAYAGGGSVTGPGGPTDDAIAARLSAGEFVVNADAAQQNAGLLNALNSGARPANDNRGSTVINISIDARGAQQGVGQEIATKLEPMIRAIAAQESARREPQTIMRSVAAAKSSAHVRGAK